MMTFTILNSNDLLVTGADWTVSSWVRLSGGDNTERVVLSRGYHPAASNIMRLECSTSNQWDVRTRFPASGNPYGDVYSTRLGSPWHAPGACVTGAWTHVAATYSHTQQTLKVFVNGREVGRHTNMVLPTYGPSDTRNRIYVGRHVDNSIGTFVGDIAEVVGWNSVLSEIDVMALCSSIDVTEGDFQCDCSGQNWVNNGQEFQWVARGRGCVPQAIVETRMWDKSDPMENPYLFQACPAGFQCFNHGPGHLECFQPSTGLYANV